MLSGSWQIGSISEERAGKGWFWALGVGTPSASSKRRGRSGWNGPTLPSGNKLNVYPKNDSCTSINRFNPLVPTRQSCHRGDIHEIETIFPC